MSHQDGTPGQPPVPGARADAAPADAAKAAPADTAPADTAPANAADAAPADPRADAARAEEVPGEAAVGNPDVDVEASRLVRIIAALVLVVLSGTFLFFVFDIRSPKGLDPAGPRFFPLLVTSAWVLLSVAYLVEGLRSPRVATQPDGAEAGTEGRPTDRTWFEPVAISALLLLYAFLVVPLGYVISTVLLFFVAARVLGSRQVARDAVVAVVLTVLVYLAFTRFLDISLPEGVLGL